jgi:hypothetical protein
MVISPSSTSTGAKSDGSSKVARPNGASVRQRKPTAAAAGSRRVTPTNNAGSMWRFYQEDSPGLKV